MKILKSILTGIGVIAVIGVSIQAVQDAPTAPKNENTEVKVVNDYNVYALPLPDNLNFAGEPVPVQNPDIKERMDLSLIHI